MPKEGSDKGGQSALLIIDVQRALFGRSTPVYLAEELLLNIGYLVERAHESGMPVFYIQHANKSFLAEGTDGWQLHSALKPNKSDIVIQKKHGNAFQKTTLRQELEARNIDTLVITGLVTNGCVRATCMGAIKLGYRAVLVKDGHSTYQKKAASIIDEWNQKLADEGLAVLPTAVALDSGL
jgi:nicotinamidase-related amidase